MSRAGTIARRTLILGSAAVAGGVAFGAYLYNTPNPNPLADGLGEGGVTFNPWVRIDGAGITLIAPHTDLGQGVRSLQAMLIAEELDLEPGQFAVETGPPDPNYRNSALAIENVGIDPADPGLGTRFTLAALDTLARTLGLQVTGGSSTVPDSFVKLREAGAIARETLKRAAAIRHRVPVEQLSTAHGAVILPDARAIPYTSLAADAAAIDPVTRVALRDPAQWRHLGKPMRRLDIVAKSTGTARYGIDLTHDGMVHAAVRTNPAQGAGLRGFDATAARRMTGVRDVIAIEGGIAAIADNSWTAMQAANAVECDWEDAGYLPDMAAQWNAVETAFGGTIDSTARDDGDVDAALGAGITVAGDYRIPYLAHAPLEPLGALVLVTDARTDMWVASQMPLFARKFVAELTGHDENDVHIHNQYAGGSFGHRLEFENIRAAARIGAALRGTPVKLTYSREEDFAHDFPRPMAMSRFRARAVNGRVEALDIAVAGPSVMASQGARAGLPSLGPDAQFHAGISNAPYAIPAMRVRAHAVERMPPTSSWRSVGASGNGFFLECALDEAILAAGGDPLAERLRLCNSPHARAVLEAVGRMSGWGTDPGRDRGRGIAMIESFGTPVAEVVEVTRTPAGIRIDRVFVAVNVGPVLDPVNFDNLVKGGVVWGLGHAMNCEITYRDGRAEQTNYHAFQGMRMHQCPAIEVQAVQTGKRITGIGEPPVPPAPAALANAIFVATGKRLREMPFNKFVDFV
ncbi:molybdopterin cofactor-binding domain-containing protein [Sphingomonas sp.]|uniref:xanthine dehydrogenase family protein molybdopterin-binding subunit n=1 Tax=Sphingomonas sp. TaxID=28214 RepID=UPI001EC82C96|nr:molybdopterin cofactor-binding domain-containing protein [Sphingomonas sp.]MBX3594617.1 xanthine dehydrogenase family protein molybdopterin-binding subunit [Sphingomonas sp.]